MAERKKLLLRLDPDVYEAVARWAADDLRSVNSQIEFALRMALSLGRLGQTFDTVVDSGLFHVFDDEHRARYVLSLAAALRPDGTCFLMCFSDREPGDWGPRRVRRDELGTAFADGWAVTRVLAVLPAHPRPFEEARTLVEHRWYGIEGERRMVDLLARLRRRTHITLNARALAKLSAS